MTDNLKVPLLSEVEEELKKNFSKEGKSGLQSTAAAAASSERVDALLLPDEMRARMPFTKEKYLVKENPQLVQWERETRKFLRQLSPQHSHRVSAIMVYEWCTGIDVQALVNGGGSANRELRHINKVLRFYFGKGYSTFIMGRKVPNCYRIKHGYYIKRHRPMTLTLYAEYAEGVLNP